MSLVNEISKIGSILFAFACVCVNFQSLFSWESGYNQSMPNESRRGGKDRLISLPEAADLYGFNADYLGQLARRGRLKAQKVGKMWVTTPADVENYIRSRKQMGAYRGDIGAED